MESRLFRIVGAILIAPVLLAAAPLASGQGAYPTRPIRMVVVTAAGGGGDMVARLAAQGMSERLGRQVVVENRAGAGGIIGYETVAKAPADGYTLVMCAPTLAINPATHKKVPYDALRDFAPISQAVFSPNIIIMHPSVPAKSAKELIAVAKSRPEQLLYASAGYGTGPHLALELFSIMAQIRMVHVPYKGTSPGITDLIAGNVALMAPAMITGLPHVRSGKLRALGVTSRTRVAAAPEIPTISESGLPGYETVVWYGFLAPAGTPQDIIARLHKESVAALQTPSARERIAADGAEVLGSSPEEFRAFITQELAKWAKVAKAAGIKPE
jgi:tripartite-type tricarboxylate transporter receptor subunit TctC